MHYSFILIVRFMFFTLLILTFETTKAMQWKAWEEVSDLGIQALAVFTVVAFTGVAMRKKNSYYKRYATIDDLHPKYLKKTHLLRGYGLTIRDGDNFRFYHTTEIQQLYWLLSGKRDLKYATFTTEDIKIRRKEGTIAIRLAGIDAPESAHFGMTAQPFSKEATEYLKKLLQVDNGLNTKCRRLMIEPLKRDQYGRLVSMVYYQPIPFLPWYRNISEEMIKLGLAVVYTAAGAEYGKLEERLLRLEKKAQKKKKGIWGLQNFVSPGMHKELFKTGKQVIRQ
eukprot:NODE_155_length_16773_cov_0.488785.p8 type:complete len:281 gc:universal NODE_155_length_16773_cov_0.488785:4548-5390(+)